MTDKSFCKIQTIRDMSMLHVYDRWVSIQKVAKPYGKHCLFLLHPGTDKTNRVLLGCLGLNWGRTANTSQPPTPNHLWASEGPSIPLHRITVATACLRLPINPMATHSFPILLPALQPVSSCATTPGLTIAYPTAFTSVNPAPVKLLSVPTAGQDRGKGRNKAKRKKWMRKGWGVCSPRWVG